ncbi:MAG: ABC transporter ATP-binding protein [bacterium]|nr:ABC transporter ATP-binding protein [bacterium]
MLRCMSLQVVYDDIVALNGVDLTVAEGQVVAVMGESGSGKSTLLRVIAGLVSPDSGSVSWRTHDISAQPPHLRHFGFMFQDYALFPHLSVGDNVGFGLRMQGTSDQDMAAATDRMLTMVGLAGAGRRSVPELSGGEQQRVALARTLAPEPDLVLLDEPLGALDRARRDQLLGDMQRIFAELGVTALYVTHDHHEAFAIANEVVVLESGDKVAQAAPADLWQRPEHKAVATLLGFPILTDVLVSGGKALVGGAEIPVRITDGLHNLAIPPGAAEVTAEGTVPVTVRAQRFEDGATQAVTDLDGIEIVAAAPHGVRLGPAALDIDGTALLVVEG